MIAATKPKPFVDLVQPALQPFTEPLKEPEDAAQESRHQVVTQQFPAADERVRAGFFQVKAESGIEYDGGDRKGDGPDDSGPGAAGFHQIAKECQHHGKAERFENKVIKEQPGPCL